jgi:ABC-type multidrug transport system fused ATPase/permease subunit
VFAPTLLLRAILQYVEDPQETPISAAWLYVILLFVSGCVQALADGQALWIGRKICLRLRAVIIGEVYSKALRRKAAVGSDTVLLDEGQKDPKAGLLRRIMLFGRKKRMETKNDNTDPTITKGTSDSQVNVGTIINLMAVDSFKVAEVSAYLHFLWGSVPIQIIVAIALLYRILGLSSIAGIGAMLLLLPVNIIIARQFRKIQKNIMTATDGRINSTNEVLQNIRIIKFFAWEERFGHIVNDKRAIELRALRSRYMLWAAAATIWYGAPIFITLSTFFIYTVIEKRDLIPSVAFTGLSLFNILRVPLDQLADMLAHVQESKVSVDRVEEFLNEEETEKYEQLQDDTDENGDPMIGFKNASFTWGSRCAMGKPNTSTAFRLIDLEVKFHVDELNIVAGPTGSGKTSLLMALLGEMTPLGGIVYLPGGKSREDLKPNAETKLTESVAYCAQQAWLVNDTIKENILFSSPFDERRYSDVLTACALTRDLQILDLGDQTLAGEKGITLSGGQKQRISLARAVYSNSRHLILDDCLSAVDSHTAKWIFDNCILGPLMYSRTCILVTHNIALCVPRAQHVVVLDNGRIASQGSPAEVIASGCLGEDIQKSRPSSRMNSEMPSRVPSDVGGEGATDDTPRAHAINGVANGKATTGGTAKPVEKSNAMTEMKAEGGVKWRIILLYLSSMGHWYFWVAAVLVFFAQQVGSIATSVWIRQWANQYNIKGVKELGVQQRTSSPIYNIRSFTPSSSFSTGCFSSGSCAWNLPFFSQKYSISRVNASANSDVDVGYYLGIYGLLGLSYMLVSLLREAILFGGSLSASWKIHKRLLECVTRARFRFFDSTPLGQIMNRFSKDIESVDQEIAPVALGMVHCLASVVSIVILISVITPGFLIAGVFISVIYFFIGKFYIRSSRDLKRLESVMRSPLYQQFGETLAGITTIRAYGDERRFIRDNLNRVDTQNRPFIYLWATNRWLAFRIDITGALVSFFAGVFVILSVGKIDAGAAGLSLTYAVTFTENVLWLVRLYAINEQNMNSSVVCSFNLQTLC